MRTISLRKFRDSIADLTEPVEVAKRSNGDIQIIGTWTPTIVHPAAIDLGPLEAAWDDLAREANPSLGHFGVRPPFTPAPKHR